MVNTKPFTSYKFESICLTSVCGVQQKLTSLDFSLTLQVWALGQILSVQHFLHCSLRERTTHVWMLTTIEILHVILCLWASNKSKATPFGSILYLILFKCVSRNLFTVKKHMFCGFQAVNATNVLIIEYFLLSCLPFIAFTKVITFHQQRTFSFHEKVKEQRRGHVRATAFNS